MKVKKLLSIGALGLVLATCTSMGVFAADRPTKDEMQTDMISMFLANRNPLQYNVNKNTKVGDVINLDTLKKTIEKYEINKDDYAKLNKALDLVKADKTLLENAQIIVNAFSKEDLNHLVSEVREVAVVLREIENGDKINNYGKYDLESDLKALVTEKNPDLNVLFGKNIRGEVSMSVMKDNQFILQLDSGDAYKLSDFLNKNGSTLVNYAQLLKSEVNED